MWNVVLYYDSDVQCAVSLRETTGAGGAGIGIWCACIVVRKTGGYRHIFSPGGSPGVLRDHPLPPVL